MDTLDGAAGLADSELANAVNKDWLLASSRSSQVSTGLHRFNHHERGEDLGGVSADCSLEQGQHYGATSSTCRQGPDWEDSSASRDQHRTWLFHHYVFNRASSALAPARGSRALISRDRNRNACSINDDTNYIYDNISFVDSMPPPAQLTRSLGMAKRQSAPNWRSGRSLSTNRTTGDEYLAADEERRAANGNQQRRHCLSANFRFFIASYLLLGITLTLYSRNALSLAAVGMVANNVINKELIELLASSSEANLNSSSASSVAARNSLALQFSAQDGSCALANVVAELGQQPANVGSFAMSDDSISVAYQPAISQAEAQLEINRQLAGQAKLQATLRESIKDRIERGELVDWTPGEQGLIFVSGSIGNLLIAIPLTHLGELYGPKWIIVIASLCGTLQAALMPLISTCKPIFLVILFQVIFNGLTHGADCVAYTLFARWLTPTEMSFFVACLLICYQLGAIISSFITARILSEGIAWSWCFYTPAILCGLWTLIWILIGSSEPEQSAYISRKELNFLQRKSKVAQADFLNSSELPAKEANNPRTFEEQFGASVGSRTAATGKRISWLKLAMDPNIWAIIAIKFTLRWYFAVYNSLMPTYLSTVAHMSVDTIGKASVFQSTVCLVSGVLLGYLTRSVVIRRPFNLSLSAFRKCFQSIVNFGLALSLIVFMIFDCNWWINIIALTVGGICVNFYVAAALQIPLDLSPNHCGLITSITNTLALGQVIGPPISGLILNSGPKNRNLWRIVWGIVVLLNTISGLLFILLVDPKRKDYYYDIDDSQGEEKLDEEETNVNRDKSSRGRDRPARATAGGR